MFGRDTPQRLRIHALDRGLQEEAHHVDIVRRQIVNDADVADSLRERPDASRIQLVDVSQLAGLEKLFHLENGGIESLHVPNHQRHACRLRRLCHCLTIRKRRSNRLLDQQRDALLNGGERDLAVQQRRYAY